MVPSGQSSAESGHCAYFNAGLVWVLDIRSTVAPLLLFMARPLLFMARHEFVLLNRVGGYAI
jgi:hypothetical protein